MLDGRMEKKNWVTYPILPKEVTIAILFTTMLAHLKNEPSSSVAHSNSFRYPFFYPKNIWPSKDLTELEPAFKNLGKVMYEAVVLLAKQVDNFTSSRIPSYQKCNLFEHLIFPLISKGFVVQQHEEHKKNQRASSLLLPL